MALDVREHSGLMLEQWRATPKLFMLMESLLSDLQTEAVDLIEKLDQAASPGDANDPGTTFLLDQLGARLNFQRPQIPRSDVGFFGFAPEDRGFRQGIIYDATAVVPVVGIANEWYWRLLQGRALFTHAPCTLDAIDSIANIVYSHGGFAVETGTREITIYAVELELAYFVLTQRAEINERIFPRTPGTKLVIESRADQTPTDGDEEAPTDGDDKAPSD